MKTRVQCLLLLAALVLCGSSCSGDEPPATTPSSTPPDATITLALTGDVMLGRWVNRWIGEKGYAYPWGDLQPDLQAADILLVNLETTLTRHTNAVPKVFNFRADPDRVNSLLAAGVDVCCLANNHVLDFGPEGMRETVDVLRSNDIVTVGAGSNLVEASSCRVVERNGLRVGFLAGTDNEPTWAATREQPGTFYVDVRDSGRALQAARQAKPEVDLLVYTTHWGPNYRQAPPRSFQRFARRMIESGVDIVHGHSAHIFQGIEVYRDGVIVYDAGDFVDDYRVDPPLRNDRSFLYTFTIGTSGLQQLELIPTLIHHGQVNHAPEPDRTESIRRLENLCRPFGTRIRQQNERIIVELTPP